MTLPSVVILLARCARQQDRTFGIRLEERTADSWYATWAFALPESMAAREGYDRTETRGSFQLDEAEYPGCAHCRNPGFVLCARCDRLGCWSPTEPIYRCPWCSASGPVGGEITRLRAGGDL